MYVDAADFDSGDWLSRGGDLSGAVNSKSGLLSCWVRKDGGDGTQMSILRGRSGGPQFEFGFISNNKLRIAADNAADTEILHYTCTERTTGPSWFHFLASWDLSDPAKRHIYVNDVSDISLVTTFTNDTIDYTHTNWAVARHPEADQERFIGALAELWFQPGVYMDLSVEANRRKFITAGGQPAVVGSDGSTPTGSAPLVYLHLDDGEAIANFATNRGTGGNFTINGTLQTASTSPSGDPLLPTTGHVAVSGKTSTITKALQAGVGHIAVSGKVPSLARGPIAQTGHLVMTGDAPSLLFYPPLELDFEAALSPSLDFEAALAPELELDMEVGLAPDLDMEAQLTPDLDFEINVATLEAD